MGWAIGHDHKHDRDIGYGVPAKCDYPGCNADIHRGLAYVCGGEPYGGEHGCGLYFCEDHQVGEHQTCEHCAAQDGQEFEPTPDTPEWINHKLADESWAKWREEHPDWVAEHSTQSGDAARGEG